MSVLPAFMGLCWAIALGIAALLLACAAVGLLIYAISAFIIGLLVRLIRLSPKRSAPKSAM